MSDQIAQHNAPLTAQYLRKMKGTFATLSLEIVHLVVNWVMPALTALWNVRKLVLHPTSVVLRYVMYHHWNVFLDVRTVHMEANANTFVQISTKIAKDAL